MDKTWFTEKIWPHMFYMSDADLWRWKMNAARAMGNSLDETYIPHLTEAFRRESDERVKAMTAWALGRIGGPAAKQALEAFLAESAGPIRSEILSALEGASPRL
jgi:epoxyqueuosine reductase